jgi:hypothetical protein
MFAFRVQCCSDLGQLLRRGGSEQCDGGGQHIDDHSDDRIGHGED